MDEISPSASSLLATNASRQLEDGEYLVRDISLSLVAGELVALIGPSGSGKSTLLRLLAFLDKPSEGTVEFVSRQEGVEQRVSRGSDIWPAVVPVFQQLFLWPHLSAWANLELATAETDGDSLIREGKDLVGRFGLEDQAERFPNELSLGERQRFALIRGLILNPSFLLLDEVTSALDVEQTELVISELVARSERGAGILFVTHSIGFARRLAKRVVFLDEGRLIETGTVSRLDQPQTSRFAKFLSVA